MGSLRGRQQLPGIVRVCRLSHVLHDGVTPRLGPEVEAELPDGEDELLRRADSEQHSQAAAPTWLGATRTRAVWRPTSRGSTATVAGCSGPERHPVVWPSDPAACTLLGTPSSSVIGSVHVRHGITSPYARHRSLDVETPGQYAPAVRSGLHIAPDRALEYTRADNTRIRLPSQLELKTEQKRGDTRDHGRRVAWCRCSAPCRLQTSPPGCCLTGCENALRQVTRAPVAEVKRRARRIHCANRQDRRQGAGNVQAVAPVVPRRGDDQDAPAGAVAHGIGEYRMGGAGWRELTPTDVDDMRSLLDGLADGPGQIELGGGARVSPVAPPLKIGRIESSTQRREALHRPVVPAKDDARDMRAVLGGRAVVSRRGHEGYRAA